jgi:UDP-N-acetylmuramoyl-tripeptide--D-alanyl-D-alanine ligase
LDITKLYDIYLKHPAVQTDTRKIKDGELFFALKGPNFNGNTYAEEAIKRGAAYAIVDEEQYADNERILLVGNVLDALQQLARHHRQQLDIPFLAITGSNGKTTTKELVTAVLARKYNVYATDGNLNNHIGVPLTLLKIKQDAEFAVIEMGANHQKEIESYCKIALPTHGIITNCGKAHIEGFGGEEGVRKGKGELYDFLRGSGGVIFRNNDLDYLNGMSAGVKNIITYGAANADYIGKPVMEDVFLNVAVLNKDKEALIRSKLVGSYNFPNVMVAIAVGLHFGIGIEDVRTAIEAYSPDNSRSQWLQVGTNKVILDAYNANPTSMRAAIINFANAKLDNKILWLGGMKEMGADEQKEHAELLALIGQYSWKQVIVVGKEFAQLPNEYIHFNSSAEAAEYAKISKPENSSILIKGSRGSKMEIMLDALKI